MFYILLLSLGIIFKSTFAFTISQIYGEALLDQWTVYVSGPYGSTRDGEYFTDFRQSLNGRSVRPNHWPDAINIRSGDSVDSVQISYGNYEGLEHGWHYGGQLHKVRLYDGDRIVKVSGRRGIGPGAGLDQLTFYTRNGLMHGPFGGDGGYAFNAIPPRPSCYLGWISGRSDVRLDAISFHWRCPVMSRPAEPLDQEGFQEVDNTNWPNSSPSASLKSLVTILLTNVIIFLNILFLW